MNAELFLAAVAPMRSLIHGEHSLWKMERTMGRGVGNLNRLLRVPAEPANGVTPDGGAVNALSRFDRSELASNWLEPATATKWQTITDLGANAAATVFTLIFNLV